MYIYMLFLRVVEAAQNNAESHLENAKNDAHLHLVGIDEVDLVTGQCPGWVDTEGIRSTDGVSPVIAIVRTQKRVRRRIQREGRAC